MHRRHVSKHPRKIQAARNALDAKDWNHSAIPVFQREDGTIDHHTAHGIEKALKGGWIRQPQKIQLARWLIVNSLAQELSLPNLWPNRLTARYIPTPTTEIHHLLNQAQLICHDNDLYNTDTLDSFSLGTLPEATRLRAGAKVTFQHSHHVLGRAVIKGAAPLNEPGVSYDANYGRDIDMHFIFTGAYQLPVST